MDSMFGACEITEVEDDLHDLKSVRTFRSTQQKASHSRPPILKLGSDKALEDDINKLFEAIKHKPSSNSMYAPEQASPGPLRKNSLKKPIGMGVPRSPGIGFSEPVSLKQALRGLCISQASEMATIKRLSMPTGSPRVSEASKIASLYRSVVVEAGESSASLNGSNNGGFEISLVPEEGTSNSSAKLHHRLSEQKSKLSNYSAHSSPRFALTTKEKDTNPSLIRNENIPVIADFHNQISETESEEDTHAAGISRSSHRSGDSKLQLKKETLTEFTCSPPQSVMETTEQVTRCTQTNNEVVAPPVVLSQSSDLELLQEGNHPGVSSPCHNSAGTTESTNIPVSNKLGNKVSGAKLRRKAKVQALPPSSSRGSSNKADKSTRKSPPSVKPVPRKKPVVKKNPKQDSTSIGSNSNSGKEIKYGMDSPGQLLCQRCRCTVTNAGNGTNEDSPAFNCASANAEVSSSKMDSVAIKPVCASGTSDKTKAVAGKASKGTKTKYKEDFSQSSKSSIGDFSSSTSISEDSNGSGSSCGNRPHMSKDLRWDAIRHVRKLHGFLGLGHFSLLKKLGSGDIGTVYLAELIGTNCLFAIKVMDNEFLARRKKMPRAQTEREILRILDHPFLPTLYAQFTSDNLSCLVMEYCPGGDLHVLRQKQTGRYFPEQAARFYVAEVLLALEYLHMLGVIYRDLKPENIMVREDGHIMLTDFDLSLRCTVNPTLLKSSASVMEPPKVSGPCNGSSCIDPFCIEPSCQVACFSPRILPAAAAAAKERKRAALLAAHLRSLPLLVAEPTDARSNSFVGTHEYLAPEIIKGDGHGSAVDWWTLGIFLYELIYGKTPFKGAGNEETLANVVLQSLRFPESPLVSFQARDLIRRLLVKEPENRLGYEKGAAEIKQHPFFEGLNWALIRCAIPPELPEFCDVRMLTAPSEEKEKKYLEYGAEGEHLEFELF